MTTLSMQTISDSLFYAGLTLFFGLHLFSLLMKTLRKGVVDRLGEQTYRRTFGAIIVLSILLIFTGYRHMDTEILWITPWWMRYATLALMPIAFIFWIAADVDGRIRQRTHHPAILGVLIWASVHLAINGDQKSAVLFGSFAAYSVFSIIYLTWRNRNAEPAPTRALGKRRYDVLASVAGLGLFAVFLIAAHEFFFGVAPFNL